MNEEKSKRREKARQRARYGHTVGSKSVFVIEQIILERATRILKKAAKGVTIQVRKERKRKRK